MSAQESHRILKTLEFEKYWIILLVQSEVGLSYADVTLAMVEASNRTVAKGQTSTFT